MFYCFYKILLSYHKNEIELFSLIIKAPYNFLILQISGVVVVTVNRMKPLSLCSRSYKSRRICLQTNYPSKGDFLRGAFLVKRYTHNRCSMCNQCNGMDLYIYIYLSQCTLYHNVGK